MVKRNLFGTSHELRYQKDSKLSFLLLLLCFSVGCVAGSLFSYLIPMNSAISDYIGINRLESSGVLNVFFHFSRFHLVAFLFGSSIFGIALLPILSFLRGFALSCTAATIMSYYPDNGIIMAAVILGFTSVISLTCYFIIAVDGFMSSSRIFHLVRGASAPKKDKLYLRTFACLPLLAIGTLIELKLVPYLVSLLT